MEFLKSQQAAGEVDGLDMSNISIDIKINQSASKEHSKNEDLNKGTTKNLDMPKNIESSTGNNSN